MKDSYLLFDTRHESVIIKTLVRFIKLDLINEKLKMPYFRLGVSTLSPELFTNVDSILREIERQVKASIKEKKTTYKIFKDEFTIGDKYNFQKGKVSWINIKNPNKN
jgi:hypothetical protein